MPLDWSTNNSLMQWVGYPNLNYSGSISEPQPRTNFSKLGIGGVGLPKHNLSLEIYTKLPEAYVNKGR